MPGISLSSDTGEGRFVQIRGIDANLDGATYGGVPLLNTFPGGTESGGGGRAVEFDTIPTGAIDGIIVTYTVLPDHEAEGLGRLDRADAADGGQHHQAVPRRHPGLGRRTAARAHRPVRTRRSRSAPGSASATKAWCSRTARSDAPRGRLLLQPDAVLVRAQRLAQGRSSRRRRPRGELHRRRRGAVKRRLASTTCVATTATTAGGSATAANSTFSPTTIIAGTSAPTSPATPSRCTRTSCCSPALTPPRLLGVTGPASSAAFRSIPTIRTAIWSPPLRQSP